MPKTAEPTKVYTGHAVLYGGFSAKYQVQGPRFAPVVRRDGEQIAFLPQAMTKQRAQAVADDMANQYARRGKR